MGIFFVERNTSTQVNRFFRDACGHISRLSKCSSCVQTNALKFSGMKFDFSRRFSLKRNARLSFRKKLKEKAKYTTRNRAIERLRNKRSSHVSFRFVFRSQPSERVKNGNTKSYRNPEHWVHPCLSFSILCELISTSCYASFSRISMQTQY